MAEIKYLADSSRTAVIDTGLLLVDGDRITGLYDNSSEEDLFCNVYLQVQWDTTAPSAGDQVAVLYVLPGDGEGTEIFPEGGDGTIGSDNDPQDLLQVGAFASVAPSITVNEVIALIGVSLGPDGNRFVLRNTSGQQFDATWELRIKPYKYQTV